MDLPNDSIGISDIIDWQECARRMTFKMKRFSGAEPPEAEVNPTKLYGAAFHDMVERVEDVDCTDEEAIQWAMSNGHRWIDEAAVEHFKTDLAIYREREPLGVRTVLNEGELRMPLLERDGKTIYLRGRIDRLYQSLTDPGKFFHRDYKSSAWPKTQEEVDNDKQFSTYNVLIHYHFPEIDDLDQTYDQLQFGELPTSRTEEQREAHLEWLRMAVTAILDDEDVGPDGLGVPSFNQWCRFCPIMESCAVIPQLTNYALAEIAQLAPAVKEGRKTIIELDPDLMDVFIEQLGTASTARQVLEKFEESVKAQLALLPADERAKYGYEMSRRMMDRFPPSAIKAMHNILGDRFYDLVSITKTSIESAPILAEHKDLILGMGDRRPGRPFVKKKAVRRGKMGTKRGPSR